MTSTQSSAVDLSIVIPVFNEQDSIHYFLENTMPCCDALNINYELVFVNDGSTDQTLNYLASELAEFPVIKVVNLSRNFGKEVALTAGIDHAVGLAVIPMDVDLQDPPEMIEALYQKYLEGFDVVLAVRNKREGDTIFKRIFAAGFYKLFKRVSDIDILENAGDFRIMGRRVIDVVKLMPERTRFMKGLLSWPGFKTATVMYDRPERFAGDTKWRFSKLWNLALDGIFSFSTLPLKVWTYIGMALSFASIAYMFYTIFKTIVMGIEVPGYASLLVVTLLIGGVNLMGIGIIGEYIGRIFIEVKARPLYVVESILDKQTHFEE